MTMILDVAPEVPLEHTMTFLTEVITSYDGSEQRIAIRKQPKQSFGGRIIYDSEAALRAIRSDLYLNTETVQFPLWHERVLSTATASSGGNTLSGDFSKSDLAATETVYIVSPTGTTETKIISVKADGQLTFSTNLANTFPAGSGVYPLETVIMGDGPTLSRYPVAAGELNLSVTMTRQPTIPGYGAAALTTYDSLTVLDERPLLSGTTAADGFERLFETFETENAVYQTTGTPYASIVSLKRFLSRSPAERQRWKLFFSTIAGGREPFWVPTWRPDLVLNAQPGASTTITVLDTGDYKTTYFDTDGILDLQFELADGTEIYRRVTNAVDNGNGTQTLTLNSILPATAIDVISFLERSRLGSDQVTFAHHGTYSEVKFSVVTAQV